MANADMTVTARVVRGELTQAQRLVMAVLLTAPVPMDDKAIAAAVFDATRGLRSANGKSQPETALGYYHRVRQRRHELVAMGLVVPMDETRDAGGGGPYCKVTKRWHADSLTWFRYARRIAEEHRAEEAVHALRECINAINRLTSTSNGLPGRLRDIVESGTRESMRVACAVLSDIDDATKAIAAIAKPKVQP